MWWIATFPRKFDINSLDGFWENAFYERTDGRTTTDARATALDLLTQSGRTKNNKLCHRLERTTQWHPGYWAPSSMLPGPVLWDVWPGYCMCHSASHSSPECRVSQGGQWSSLPPWLSPRKTVWGQVRAEWSGSQEDTGGGSARWVERNKKKE